MSEKIVLIDGHSIMNRAFYGVPDLTNREGFHTNAIYGFINILLKVLDEEQPTHLLVAFDLKAPTFRHKMYAQYKGTRKPMPEELRQQIPEIKKILKAMNVCVVEQAGIEADDILGTMATRAQEDGISVSLISGDRDLLQLASAKIKIRIPKSSKGQTTVEDYQTDEVIEKYGVTPKQIIDLKGLMGDASDNIPGVPGIGEKTAAKILQEYPSVEEAIEHAADVKPPRASKNLMEFKEQALLSKELATIKTDCDLDVTWKECEHQDVFTQEAFPLIQRLELKTLLKRFDTTIPKAQQKKLEYRCIDSFSEAKNAVELMQGCAFVGIKVLYDKEGVNQGEGQLSLFEPEIKQMVIGYALSIEDSCIFLRVGDTLSNEQMMMMIKNLLKHGVRLVTTGLKEQLPYLPELKVEQTFDAGVAAYVINPNLGSYWEEEIAQEYVGLTLPNRAALFGKKEAVTFYAERADEVIQYICGCAFASVMCVEPLISSMKETGAYELFESIEMPLVFTLYDMEQWGIEAHLDELKEYSEQLGERIHVLEENIYAMAGETFNINSPKQLGVILFEKMGLPYGKKTKTGYSTNADVLEKLKNEDAIIPEILEYRQLAKLKSTYADGLGNYITSDGRIHSTFQQTIAATGRLSSTEPNLQNIPIRLELGRKIRKVFVPEDGFVFLDADYSQIELRILAHMSGDESLIQAFCENQDIHRMTASQVFHTPFDEVSDLQRRNAKAVNFGIVYGISAFGLSQDLDITRKEASEYIESYFATYPKVKQFMDDMVTQAKEKGYVTTLFGRRRPIPELSSSNFMQRSFGERIAMNSPIQGTAADIIKVAMIRVNDELKKRKLKSRLILQIHDELLVETDLSEKDEVAEIMQTQMEQAADILVPLLAEVKEGANWYEAK